MFTSPGFILLIVVLGVAAWRIRSTGEPMRRADKRFTPGELKKFRELSRSGTSSAEMPIKFRNLSESQRRLSRVYLMTIAAIMITVFAILFLGWGLGLTPNA